MSDDYFFSNNFFRAEGEDNNSLFSINENNYFDLNFFQNEPFLDINSDNNSIQFKNDLYPENNLTKELPKIIPSPVLNNYNDSSKMKNSDKSSSNISSSNMENNSSSTKEKSQLKNNQQSFSNEIGKNKLLEKKRRPRIHLEDIDIDPEIKKNNKFYIVGDKVIISKNQILTNEEKKEVKRLRNIISAKKNRSQKKIQFNDFKEKIKYLTSELNQKNLIIENMGKICCSSCKSRLMEMNKKIIEDNDINNIISEKNNKEKDNFVLEENNSLISNKNNSFVGKISSIIIGLISLLGIILFFEGGAIVKNGNKIDKNLYMTKFESSLRHLRDNICSNEEENNLDEENEDKEINLPLPVKFLKFNNLLNMCHEKFNRKISNLKSEKEKKGEFLEKINESIYLNNNNILDNNYIINNNNFQNNLPVQSKKELEDKVSSKIISVFVKDYKPLKNHLNERSLPLQEQIENETKNSEDGSVYLQMIIPKEIIKNNFDENLTYSEIEKNFFEIRCKILEFNNYYTQGINSH